MPARNSDNLNRRLLEHVDGALVDVLLAKVKYKGYSKHKRNPRAFGLPHWQGHHGDATLCDEHANFTPQEMSFIEDLLRRGIQAELIGENDLIWSVTDSGWIMEARVTNRAQYEYHGYPVRPNEAIAGRVYERFATWAAQSKDPRVRKALELCKNFYGFDD